MQETDQTDQTDLEFTDIPIPAQPPEGEGEAAQLQSDPDTDARSIMSFKVPPENDPDELLKHRFLSRGGALLLVGPTGVGKSSLSMQLMMAWALGRTALGITPARPLKSLLIQAENDDGDIAEFCKGVVGGMGLTAEERDAVGEMVFVKMEDSRAGDEFITFVRAMAERHRPDLLWIDPAFAFLGGESNSAQDVGHFLRQGLNPIIHEFQCGVVVIHHTAKPLKAVDGGGPAQSNPAYAGSGSAEWANWSRATLTLDAMGDGKFSLIAGKRQSRLRWKDEAGCPVYQQIIAHCKEDGRIWWETATADEVAAAAARDGKPQKTVADLLKLVPPSREISAVKLQEEARLAGINEKRFRTLRKLAVENEELFEWRLPQPGAPPAVHLALFPQPKADAGDLLEAA
jgi:hypothetical protein